VSTPEIELVPEQPDAVAIAIANVLGVTVSPKPPGSVATDPWWQTGLTESLEA
jgi:hypothetical protein